MSSRTISVERTYSLGQYQNIKLYDSIIELPQEVMFNNELIGKIRYLQFIQMEIQYRAYLDLARRLQELGQEELLPYLEELKVNTIDEIKELLEKEKK